VKARHAASANFFDIVLEPANASPLHGRLKLVPARAMRRPPPRGVPSNPGVRQLLALFENGGWTRDKFAEHIGVCRQTLSNWFNGTSVPNRKTVERIMARGVPVDMRSSSRGAKR